MQEKSVWSYTFKTLCPDVDDATCLKDMANLASDDVSVSTNCFKDSNDAFHDNEFSTDNVALDEKNSTVDGKSCLFPLDDIFSTDSNFDFFVNDHGNKESTHLPCFEWPDVDKFEDFDGMCRGYDSPFVPGHVSNEDDMSFFSSSLPDLGGPVDVVKSGFKSSLPESGSNPEEIIKSVSNEQPIASSSNLPPPNSTDCIPEHLYLQHLMQFPSSVASPYEILAIHAALTGVHQTCDELAGHCEVDGLRMNLSAGELDSSHLQENSCLSSILLEENSLKTSSFQQLQLVMEQLDVRMKLCIRDGLYRLAKIAKRRHNLGTSDGSGRDDGKKSQMTVIEEQVRCTRLVDNETHTNPIDRCIAQLLFHMPSEPGNDAISLQSHAKAHKSTANQSVLPENVCEEDTASNVDTKLQVIDQNTGR